MKKFLLSLSLVAFALTCTLAQTNTPRFGITKNSDNTGRVITYGASTVTPTSTMVTISSAINNKSYNYVSVSSVSISPTFTANVTSAAYGDQLDLFVRLEATGTRTITFSTNFICNAAATQTLAASKQATFRFVFDGNRSKYVEVARSIEP